MNKLPQITVSFWIMKICATTLGETAGDLLSMTMNVGYAASSVIFFGLLVAALVFQLTAKRYHALLSNTLGTALGDFLADNSGLGFAGGALLIGGLLVLVTLAAFYTRFSKVLLFWVAFVLTRPFGATLGDVLTKTKDKGGLNLGTVNASIILASILGIVILLTTLNDNKVKKAAKR